MTFYYENQWYWGLVKSCTVKAYSQGDLRVEILATTHDENSMHPYPFMFRKGRRVECWERVSEIDAKMNGVIIKGWELVQ